MTFEFPVLSARIIISPTLREVPQNVHTFAACLIMIHPKGGNLMTIMTPVVSRDVLAISSLGRWFETLIFSFTTKEDDAIQFDDP